MQIKGLPDLKDDKIISFRHKRSLVGFFEEIALMMNSGLLKPRIAHYMFGYYAIACWKSEAFWSNMNRDSIYWALFKDFAEKMQQIEEKSFRRGIRFKF